MLFVVAEAAEVLFRAELFVWPLLSELELVFGGELVLLLSRDETSNSSGDCEGESEDEDDDELTDVDE